MQRDDGRLGVLPRQAGARVIDGFASTPFWALPVIVAQPGVSASPRHGLGLGPVALTLIVILTRLGRHLE
jgi:hypothetical protein